MIVIIPKKKAICIAPNWGAKQLMKEKIKLNQYRFFCAKKYPEAIKPME